MGRRSDHTRDELKGMVLKAAGSIIAQEGLRALTTRRIGKHIGYAAGTLYQLYRNLDDIILHVNTQTLEAMLLACSDVDLERAPEEALLDLADRYLSFIERHPRLWSALFEHAVPVDFEWPIRYNELIATLLGLVVKPLATLIPHDETLVRHEARTMWSCLYGIGSLALSEMMAEGESPRAMIASLVANYLAGLRFTRGLSEQSPRTVD